MPFGALGFHVGCTQPSHICNLHLLLCYGISSSVRASLTVHKMCLCKNFASPPTPSLQLCLCPVKPPITYVCWEHAGHRLVEEIHRELTVRLHLWVASYSATGPLEELVGKRVDIRVRNACSISSSERLQDHGWITHHLPSSASLSVTSLSETILHLSWLGQNRVKSCMWTLCKLWSAMRYTALLLPLWCRPWSTQESPWEADAVVCSPHNRALPLPCSLNPSCIQGAGDLVWYPGVITTHLKELWKSCPFFAALRKACELIHTYMTPEGKHCHEWWPSSLMGYSSLM